MKFRSISYTEVSVIQTPGKTQLPQNYLTHHITTFKTFKRLKT